MQGRLQAELKPGEFVKWAGQPEPSRYARQSMAVWIFFIPWTAFAIFWMAAASGFRFPSFHSGWDAFPLFGLPFVLVGFAGLSSPIWMRMRAQYVLYAITDQRALSISGKTTIKVTTYLPKDLGTIERVERADGYGNLILQSSVYHDSDGDRHSKMQGFMAIADVRKVQTLLEDMLQSNTPKQQNDHLGIV